MLEFFRVKNFMSFHKSAVLDMRATVLKQHPSHIIHCDKPASDNKNGILKTAAIYGANASGKSNLISALYSMKMFMYSQLYQNTKSRQSYFKLEPFLLCDSSDTTEFEIVFTHNNSRIQYGFEILISKIETPDTEAYDRDEFSCKIINEWYYINGDEVFERENSKLKYGNKYKSIIKDYQKLPSDRLYISVLDYFLDDESKITVLGDLLSYFRDSFNVYSEPIFEFSVKRMGSFTSVSKKILEDEEFRNKVNDYLKRIDVGIDNLVVDEEVEYDKENEKYKKQKSILTSHRKYSETGEYIGTENFRLSMESSGTLRFLAYIQHIINIMETGGVFIVDELSDKLHPLLTKFIIDCFQSEENKKAQLIFSTHDVFQFTKEQFRRDEIYLVDKDIKGESLLIPFTNKKAREDATFNKDYISGKYGAVPVIKDRL